MVSWGGKGGLSKGEEERKERRRGDENTTGNTDWPEERNSPDAMSPWQMARLWTLPELASKTKKHGKKTCGCHAAGWVCVVAGVVEKEGSPACGSEEGVANAVWSNQDRPFKARPIPGPVQAPPDQM